MPEAQARRLFGQLLDGLAYCHGQGVYHRDLRVEHVLLSGRWGMPSRQATFPPFDTAWLAHAEGKGSDALICKACSP